MKTTPPRLVFFGNEIFSTGQQPSRAAILSGLIEAGWDIEAVVIKQRRRRRRQPVQPAPILAVVAENRGRLIEIDNHKDLNHLASKYDFKSELAIVAGFGYRLPQKLVDHFKTTIINIHPSLLPVGRGPSPVETSIKLGQTPTGVSLIKLTDKIDGGPIYDQVEVEFDPETVVKADLTESLNQAGANLLLKNIEAISQGRCLAKPQAESAASLTATIKSDDRHLDWSQPAAVLDRQIRAQAGWPGAIITIGKKPILIISSYVISPTDQATDFGRPHYCRSTQSIVVTSGAGRLGISHVQPPGGRIMTAAEFNNGYGPLV